jgi:hypothetical protein
MNAPKKFIQIKSSINHHRVGCDVSYFIRHLEARPLQVVMEDQTKVHVRDAADKVWTAPPGC